jgi:hypothetical protein
VKRWTPAPPLFQKATWRGLLGVETSKITRPASSPRAWSAGCASRFASMRPLAARTLWEWVPGGTSSAAICRGARGSATSTTLVPCGAFMWAM